MCFFAGIFNCLEWNQQNNFLRFFQLKWRQLQKFEIVQKCRLLIKLLKVEIAKIYWYWRFSFHFPHFLFDKLCTLKILELIFQKIFFLSWLFEPIQVLSFLWVFSSEFHWMKYLGNIFMQRTNIVQVISGESSLRNSMNLIFQLLVNKCLPRLNKFSERQT